MKYVIILFVIFSTSSVIASEVPKSPSGEEVFDALFNGLGVTLGEEPLCNMESITRKNPKITLGQHLSTILAVSYESKNISTMKSSCQLSKFEGKDGKVLDIWDCKIHINESNENKEFISSSTIAFNMTLDKTKLIKGSLRCL